MGYAYYVSLEVGAVKAEPGWYDELNQVRDEDIVGWAIWFNSGDHYCSLDTEPTSLPAEIVQVLRVWYYQTREPEHIVSGTYTREVYPIPLSDVILTGGWTDMMNHNAITKEASTEQWPPSWVTK